jgi:hypothetical protein
MEWPTAGIGRLFAAYLAVLLLAAAGCDLPEDDATDPDPNPGTTTPQPTVLPGATAGVDFSHATPLAYGGMTGTYSGAAFDTVNMQRPHWVLDEEGEWIEFTFDGQHHFNIRECGSLWSDGRSYTEVEVVINGSSIAPSMPRDDGQWEIYTFWPYRFERGRNTLRIILRRDWGYGLRTHLWLDHVWLSAEQP